MANKILLLSLITSIQIQFSIVNIHEWENWTYSINWPWNQWRWNIFHWTNISLVVVISVLVMGLLADAQKCGLRMHRKCFPCHRFQRKPLVSDPGMHHGMCVTHVPWWMSGSLTRGGRENVPGIPGACASLNFTYLARGPFQQKICGFEHINTLQTKNTCNNLSLFVNERGIKWQVSG